MKKVFVFTVVALLLVSCGGNSPDAAMSANDGGDGVDAVSLGSADPPIEIDTFFAYDYPPENGFKEVVIGIRVRNASNQYLSFYIDNNDEYCRWNFGLPTLTTVGTDYTYEAEQFDKFGALQECGSRKAEMFPPGATLGDSIVRFNIPEQASPDKITFTYEYGVLGELSRTQSVYTGKVSEAGAVNALMYTPENHGVEVYQLGDTIPLGTIAELRFVWHEDEPYYPLFVEITNNHDGYSLGIESLVATVWSDLDQHSDYNAAWDLGGEIGPLYTESYMLRIDIPEGLGYKNYYLFWDIKVSVSSEETAEKIFAVQIPVQ